MTSTPTDSIRAVPTSVELIEARRQLEERSAEVATSVALLRATVDASPDAIVATDQRGDIILSNRRFREMWRIPDAIPIMRNASVVRDFVAPMITEPARLVSRAQEMLEHPERELRDEFTLTDGRIVERFAGPRHHDGAVVGSLVMWRDVTEQRRAQQTQSELTEQLRQLQKMESLGALAGGIAHDFGNIVSAILGNSALVRSTVRDDPAAIEALDAIDLAGARGATLVQQILAFTRRHPLARKALHLDRIVVEAARLLRATIPAGIEISMTLDADIPHVIGDATQLHQIVMNLCANAMRAVQDRGGTMTGRIEMRVQSLSVRTPMPVLSAGTLAVGEYVRLSVSDDGVGIPPSTLHRIFDPYFTTRAPGKGTGLGLSVVHGIVAAHDGAIDVESVPGQGTTFHLYFPVSTLVESDSGPVRPRATPRLSDQSARVLLVDDEAAIISMATRLLKLDGHVVRSFEDPDRALEVLREDPSAFDILITDYNMPHRSGLDLTRAVRALRADLPIVITSGYVSPELNEQANDAGAGHLLYKPDLARQLGEVVRRFAAIPRADI